MTGMAATRCAVVPVIHDAGLQHAWIGDSFSQTPPAARTGRIADGLRLPRTRRGWFVRASNASLPHRGSLPRRLAALRSLRESSFFIFIKHEKESIIMTRQPLQLDRRRFLAASSLISGAAVTGWAAPAGASAPAEQKKFHMHFAPHPGMFSAHAGPDVLAQIKFSSQQGFTAWEQNGLPNETPEMQEKIGQTLREQKMTMGVFVAYASFDEPTFAAGTKEQHEEVLKKMRQAVDIAKRVGATWCTVVPGSVDQQAASTERWNRYGGARLAQGYQTANTIELLRRCAEILEPHKVVMVLEPLNWYANHGGTFLQRSDQAYAICKAVNSPSCKILFDIYHQQITEGNLIPNIENCWDEIAYFQAGDNPGRKEPGTGEIHYENIFKKIDEKSRATGRNFVVGMEHGKSKSGKAGEVALIEAYRQVDPGQ